MRVLPHGAIVLGLKGSEDAFNTALNNIKDNLFSGYMEVRTKIRGGELWGVVVFDDGKLVETYANRLGTDLFGDTAYMYIIDLATDATTDIILHELDSKNIMDFIMSGRGRKIKIEDGSWRPGGEDGEPNATTEGGGPPSEMNAKTRMIKKVVLLGNPSVGKTSTMRRFVEDTFDEAYLSTIGSNVNKKTVTIVDDDFNAINMTLMIWDVAGDKACDTLKRAYYRGAHGAIVVCDITLESSFKELDNWLENVHDIVGEIPVIIVGNKADLADLREVDFSDLQASAERYGTHAYETSARTGENVEMVFQTIARMMAS